MTDLALARATIADQNNAAAPRVLSDLFTPDVADIPNCFNLPPIPAGMNFHTPYGLLQAFPKFYGLPTENCFTHVQSFLMLCSSQNEQTIGIDAYRLRIFPLTVLDRAQTWLDNLLVKSIRTWPELSTRFFDKFFPVHKRRELENKIISFEQYEDEELDVT